MLGADQGGDQIVQSGAGADFVIRVRRRSSDFAVGKQLAREAFAQNEQLDGFAERHFPKMQSDVLLAPGHIELGFKESSEISSESF